MEERQEDERQRKDRKKRRRSDGGKMIGQKTDTENCLNKGLNSQGQRASEAQGC